MDERVPSTPFRLTHGNIEIIHGIITDVSPVNERRYGMLYKAFRSLIYGEPYQIRKASTRNPVAHTSYYRTIRVEPEEDASKLVDVTFIGDSPDTQYSAGDEVELRCRRTRFAHYFISGYNCARRMPIERDRWVIQPELFRVLILIPTALLTILIISLIALGTAIMQSFA